MTAPTHSGRPQGRSATSTYTHQVNVAVVLVNDLATVLDIYALCIFAWALLSFFPGGRGSSLGRLLDALVMPLIRPLRRVVPSIGGMDFSPLLAIVVVYAVAGALQAAATSGFVNIVGTLVSVVLAFISAVLVIIVLLLLIRALIGLLHVDPWHPLVHLVRQITDAFVVPVARVTRTRGEGAALAAFVVFLVVYVALVQIVFPIVQHGAYRL